MKKIIILSAFAVLVINSVLSQGCVFRSATLQVSWSGFAQLGYGQSNDKWLLDINNRYFQASQVYSLSTPKPWDGLTIYTYTTNFGLSRILENGWSMSLDVPISANSISSIIEHRSGFRHTTSAYGLSDIRFTLYKWLFHGSNSQRGNIQVGAGIKFPTGSDKDEDYFYADPSSPKTGTLAPVNVAIQLGDGGYGIYHGDKRVLFFQ